MSYICSIKLKTVINMETKKFAEENAGEFAEKHAGEYFLFRNRKVRVVGYYAKNGHSILVSVSPRVHNLGWSKLAMDEYDVFVIRSRASAYRYFDESDSKRWK